MSGTEPTPGPTEDFEGVEVPEPVRARLVAVVSGVLGHLAAEQLPPALRKVATFAPARRAKLAADQIMAAVPDAAFRGNVVGRLKVSGDPLLRALESDTGADTVDRAVAAYLVRGKGARSTYDAAVAAIEREADREAESSARAQLDRTEHALADVRADLESTRERYKEQLATLKAENAELRRKVNALRVRARDATAETEEAQRSAERVAAESEADVSVAEAETRRLRARVAELEEEQQAARRAAREGKDLGTTRARLLLDTLVDAAQGLRRELALPPVEVRPADTVPAAEPGSRPASDRARALHAHDPAVLEELLGMPQVHLVVDGYNVTKQEWGAMSLAEQRTRLLRELGGVQARCGAEVTVVFDGADLEHVPTVASPRGVRVRFSPPGVIADAVIADLVRAEPQGRAVIVVSSDGEVAGHAVRSGARAVAAQALVGLLRR